MVVLDSQRVAEVLVLTPVTSTAMYLPFCAELSLKRDRVALLITRQVPGMLCVACVTFAVQAYHLYVNVGVGYPIHRPLLTLSFCPTRGVPKTMGFVVADARVGQRTSAGVLLSRLSPVPSCPNWLLPQQVTVPSEINAHVC